MSNVFLTQQGEKTLNKMAVPEREDLRIQKTKKKLFETFIEMLAEKNFEDITVNELCSRAQIRRATFYKHFEDKMCFCTYVLQVFRHRFDRSIWKKSIPDATADYYIAYATELIEFIDNNEKMVTNLLSSSMLGSLMNIVLSQNFKDTLSRLESSEKQGMMLVTSANTVTAMLSGGVCVSVLTWLHSKKEKPKEMLIKELSSIIAKILN